MAGKDVTLTFSGEMDDLKQSLARMEDGISTWGKSITSIGVGAFAAWGASAAISGATALVQDAAAAIQEYVGMAQEAAAVQAKLEAVVKATGGAAGFTADEFAAMALDLREITNIDDDVIKGAQTMLATFKEIKGDEFERTTKAALDMATVLGGDASSAAMQLGKALNDPEKGLTMLTKSGVSFTDQQAEMVKAMIEWGDVAGAQNIILGEMEAQFGGAAEAAASAAGGGLAQVKFTIDDIKESIGERLLPIIDELVPALQFTAVQGGEYINSLMEVFSDLADSITASFDVEGPAEQFIAIMATIEHEIKRVVMEIEKQFLQAQRLGEVISNPIDSVFSTKMTELERELVLLVDDIENMGSSQDAVNGALAQFRAVQAEDEAERANRAKPKATPSPSAPAFDFKIPSLDQIMGAGGDALNSPIAGELKKMTDAIAKPFMGLGDSVIDSVADLGKSKPKDQKQTEEVFQSSFEGLSDLFRRVQSSAASGTAKDDGERQVAATKETTVATKEAVTVLKDVATALKRPQSVAVLGP